MFDKVELSVSAYDTAWVAMVPSPTSPNKPCFPQCLNWLLNNQLFDGSWGINPHEPMLVKDMLSSTLACVLSLKKWGVGEEQMNKGVHYIQSKFEYTMDAKQVPPTGFEMIFPSMIEYARDLNLKLNLEAEHLSSLFQNRDFELERITGRNLPGIEAYMVYTLEGMGELVDQETVMKYQRKNGSLFNSPSITAAISTHLPDSGCLSYLQSVLDQFGNAVPTVYPLDIYARLCMVDALVRTGIDHHFATEIQNVLDVTYRYWEEEEEEIFLDVSTCAMAFRLLRVNGYEVSPCPLAQFATKDNYLGSLNGHLNDMNAVLELHRASEVITRSNESVLRNINAWTRPFLIQKCVGDHVNPKSRIRQEVDDALKFPSYASLQGLENKRFINIYGSRNSKVLKTSYICTNTFYKEILKLAAEDFNSSQSFLREEFIYFERWVTENRLDEPQFARQGAWNMYFSAATVFVSPELSDARLALSKSSMLMLVLDDFFDVTGSKDDLENFTHLFGKWDLNLATDSFSEDVRILFSAVHRGVTEMAEAAKKYQQRDVTSHLIDVFLKMSRAMFEEAEWRRNGYLPTFDEYITIGHVTVAVLPIVHSAMYFVGPLISEEAVNSAEFQNLSKTLGVIARVLNDIGTFERESTQGKQNAVTLHMAHAVDSTKEMVIQKLKKIVAHMRMELLRLVLRQDTEVPNACKQVFWKMCKILHAYYQYTDLEGFVQDTDLVDSIEILNLADSVLHEPISLD
ncbi:unnamed protein product [Rhodiola kirilowii]